MNIEVDKIAVDIDVIVPDAVVVEASAVAPSGIVTEAVAELPTQVIVISHEEIPTISPLEIVDYGYSSIECAFDVTTQEADEVVKGVLCGTVNPPTFDNADYRLLHGQGNMDLVIAGLHTNTEYYLRPYALSNLGCKYGDVVAQRTKASPIPNEYQLVEYLESTGTQYINTGYYPNMTDTIEVTYALTNLSENQGYGCISTNPIRRCHTRTVGVANAIFYSSSNFISYPSDTNYHTYKWDLSDVSIDGTYSHRNENVYPDYEFYLFARNSNGTVSDFCKSRCKGFKVYNILEMYPVYRKSDSKPGMYDILTNEFYTNAGTREFIVGPDKEWEE